MIRAMSPMEVITKVVGDNLAEHEKMVQDCINTINNNLFCVVSHGNLGIEQSLEAEFTNITQIVLTEVVLEFRKQGWAVGYSYTKHNTVKVVITIPAQINVEI